jgi:hypothetical protein
MGDLTVEDALRLLHAAGQVVLRSDGGDEVPVTMERLAGPELAGTAPRVRVASGRQLTARIVDPGGAPWIVHVAVEQAVFHTDELAAVILRVTGVEIDHSRRLAQRVPAGGIAWLEAVRCQEVVDGDRVDATMVDVSTSGVALATGRVLRRGDRLRFHGRFFAEMVTAEVRVMSIRYGGAGRSVYGCQFIEIDAGDLARLERIIEGQHVPETAPVDVAALRRLMVDDAGGWRRRLRRAS